MIKQKFFHCGRIKYFILGRKCHGHSRGKAEILLHDRNIEGHLRHGEKNLTFLCDTDRLIVL